MVARHACPRSPLGSPDNLSLQAKTSISFGFAILVIIAVFPLTGLAGGGGTDKGETTLTQFGSFSNVAMDSCVITIASATTCSNTVTFSPSFPLGVVPNVTLANSQSSSPNGIQDELTGRIDFFNLNTSTTIKIQRNCSFANPCDLSGLASFQPIPIFGMQDFAMGLACINMNYTGSITLEVYSSTTISGVYADSGQGVSMNGGNCLAPVTFFQGSTPIPDSGTPACDGTPPASPCFYKVLAIQSPSTQTTKLVLKAMYLLLVHTYLQTADFTIQIIPSDNTGFSWNANFPTRVAATAIPLSVNISWIATACITVIGYHSGSC